jgi:hypothetical protein
MTQRRHGQGHRAQTVEQIFAKTPVLNGVGQILVGRADQARLESDRAGAAHGFESCAVRSPAAV